MENVCFPEEKTVLLVDDDPATHEIMAELFDTLGIELHHAENGQTGADKAIELKPDLILMDLYMPEMDGLEATRKIRSNPGCPGIPIILLTASEFFKTQDELSAMGVSDYVPKPVEFHELLPVLQKHLGGDKN